MRDGTKAECAALGNMDKAEQSDGMIGYILSTSSSSSHSSRKNGASQHWMGDNDHFRQS